MMTDVDEAVYMAGQGVRALDADGDSRASQALLRLSAGSSAGRGGVYPSGRVGRDQDRSPTLRLAIRPDGRGAAARWLSRRTAKAEDQDQITDAERTRIAKSFGRGALGGLIE